MKHRIENGTVTMPVEEFNKEIDSLSKEIDSLKKQKNELIEEHGKIKTITVMVERVVSIYDCRSTTDESHYYSTTEEALQHLEKELNLMSASVRGYKREIESTRGMSVKEFKAWRKTK